MGQLNCCRGSRDEPEPVQQSPPVPALPRPPLRERLTLALGRRMRLPWPFRQRETSATTVDVPRPSGCGGSGLLFGQPLAALCSQDGRMPQPIQDLLALLHQRGPSTEGIFRLAAGKRDLGALREALDSGQEVPLQSQPVHLLAATLKDFLRKIPSKLLEAELYQQWMGALHQSSRQARLAALKEVTSKLPQANLILLKSLLSLLHNISSNTDSSRMTARSLAICVGPNLLSPVEEPPLDMLPEVTSKVTELVELLIELQGELFAEEQVPGSDGPSAEEEPGTTEVPPLAPGRDPLKSSSEESSSPGSSQVHHDRRAASEEGCDEEPGRKKKKKLEGVGRPGQRRKSIRARRRRSPGSWKRLPKKCLLHVHHHGLSHYPSEAPYLVQPCSISMLLNCF
ncbi:T-cell activation Rho GTPase-activating protein-like [Pogoniulus pusillus]|uniref:T-cell activation Rho GTPase-activating protein-like n=1 Tax=Pogoniulus pusillus TaxID=488313 RepID=UPI0030B92A91